MLKGGLTGESSGASAGGASGCSCYYFSNLCLVLEKCFRNFYHTYITPIFLGVCGFSLRICLCLAERLNFVTC